MERRESGSGDPDKLASFTKTLNNAQQYMYNIDSSILCGNDHSDFKVFLDYFVEHIEGVGFLSFHKYDGGGTWLYHPEIYPSDCFVLRKASFRVDFPWDLGTKYSPSEMQEKWKVARGETLPVLCTETDLNSAWQKGTDPRIQQPIGAAWYIEELRFFILNDVKYSIYYNFAGDDSGEWTQPSLPKVGVSVWLEALHIILNGIHI